MSIAPEHFNKSLQDAIQEHVHGQYSAKFLPQVGQCVSVYDIISSTAPKILPDKCEYHIEVVFRLVVFRPLFNEILTARIIAADPRGLRLSIGGFFTKVKLLPHLLQEGTTWDALEKIWVWNYEDHRLYMDVGDLVRFRVQAVHYDSVGRMKIHGRVNESGLGMLKWWM